MIQIFRSNWPNLKPQDWSQGIHHPGCRANNGNEFSLIKYGSPKSPLKTQALASLAPAAAVSTLSRDFWGETPKVCAQKFSSKIQENLLQN